MRLTLEDVPPSDDPDQEALADAISSIDGEKITFALLERDGLTYIQTCASGDATFILEYQEGSTDKHFRCPDEALTKERVTRAFQKYARGDETWRADFSWEKDTVAAAKHTGGC